MYIFICRMDFAGSDSKMLKPVEVVEQMFCVSGYLVLAGSESSLVAV